MGYKGLARTTQRLCIDRPALSGFLRGLRRSLKLILFRHKDHQLGLACTKRQCCTRIRHVLDRGHRVSTRVASVLHSSQNILCINVPPFQYDFSLPGMLPVFRGRFPRMRFHVVRTSDTMLSRGLLGNRVSLTFCVSFRQVANLDCRMVRDSGVCTVLSGKRPLRTGTARVKRFSLR